MDNLLGKNIFSLSGGEKQKIACASVSASNPPIIVLDEPSSNLDMSATKDLRRMIQIWKQQGKTVIIAEHRLYYLKELIDRVVYLKNGKIEKDYSALDALKLSVTQQAKMGLRPFDLGAFPVTAHPVASRSSIECENFHFAYTKQRDVLDIDSLSLPQAGIIAVIGHNGAGKSTLARCLCGLEKHCKGIVKVDALNKKDPDAIVYMDANEVIVRLTREDFASEEEFLKWKSWSDGNYHTEDNQDVVEGKHNTSIDGLSEAAFSIPAIDVVMERQHEKVERRRVASAMVSQIRDKLTETQFRRLWMYYIDGMTVDEIGEKEGVSHQAASLSITTAIRKIKKYF